MISSDVWNEQKVIVSIQEDLPDTYFVNILNSKLTFTIVFPLYHISGVTRRREYLNNWLSERLNTQATTEEIKNTLDINIKLEDPVRFGVCRYFPWK